ncbi:MAG: extracellular solute-binding protein [Gammaproteobacteria bacterium]|nr:extracellular solute-binding protein [Gammaproteobacteria bacterium]
MKFGYIVLMMLSVLAQPMAVQAADELVIYSGRSDKFVRPVVEAFEKKTGIKVIIHNAKSVELINKLNIESDKTKADLFLSNDAGSLQTASSMGLLSPIPEDHVKMIPSNYRAKDNSWIGLSARARVLVVNTKKADQLGFVKSVMDLADPRLKGRLGITHSSNGSFIAGVTVYQKKLGDKKILAWLKGLVSNSEGKVYNKHSKIVRDVALGKKDIGLVNHYYIYRHLDKKPDAPIRILIPDQGEKGMGVAWNVAGIGIVKHSSKKALAMKLVDFLVSVEGQKIFAEVNREYPTRKDVKAASQIPANGSYKVADVEMSELGKQRKATVELIDKAGML